MRQIWTPWRMAYIRREKRPGCIFCQMLEAENDPEMLILYRNEHAFLVMNRYPYNNGHLMAVPYRHAEALEGLQAEEMAGMMAMTTLGVMALRRTARPQGFNIGINLGEAAGAGVVDHVHTHVVPRWNGDTNFMPVFGEVRVIPQALHETYAELKAAIESIVRDS